MTRLLVHIGLGKTGSTTLQRRVLPFLKLNDCIQYEDDLQSEVSSTYYKSKFLYGKKQEIPKIDTNRYNNQKPIIISNETLIGPNPGDYRNAVHAAKNFLPCKSEILITLRRQKDWLTSFYTYYASRSYFCPNPEDFFADSKKTEELIEYFGRCNNHYLSVDEFSFEEIHNLWKTEFKKVTLIPLENIFTEVFYSALELKVPAKIRAEAISLGKIKLNTSISDHSFKMTQIRNKILMHYFKYPLRQSEFGTFVQFYTEKLGYELKPSDEEVEWFLNELSQTVGIEETLDLKSIITEKWGYKLFAIMTLGWREFMSMNQSEQRNINKKYILPDDIYLGKHYDSNEVFYERLLREGSIS